MTVIVASLGFIMVPDRPGDAKVPWMTKEDEMIAEERMERVNSLPPTVRPSSRRANDSA
jgi:uncharacterized membrane-anchored protein